MKSISYDELVLTTLSNCQHLKVHSIFQKGINILVDDQATLLFLYANPMRLLPNSILLSIEDFNQLKRTIHLNSCVKLLNNQLIIDNVNIHLSGVQYTSLMSCVNELNNKCYQQFEKEIMSLNVINGFHQKISDSDDAMDDYQSLIGKGIGLTPSGDDMIVGMYAASLFFPHKKPIINLLKELTNDISYSYLQLAQMNRFDSTIKRLTDYLIDNTSESIDTIISDLISYGHTSGIDVLSGYYSFLRKHISL